MSEKKPYICDPSLLDKPTPKKKRKERKKKEEKTEEDPSPQPYVVEDDRRSKPLASGRRGLINARFSLMRRLRF